MTGSETSIPERWVGVEEVAKHLGVGVGYVRRLAEAKKIPGSDLGYGKKRYWRFRISKVDAAINSPEFAPRDGTK